MRNEIIYGGPFPVEAKIYADGQTIERDFNSLDDLNEFVGQLGEIGCMKVRTKGEQAPIPGQNIQFLSGGLHDCRFFPLVDCPTADEEA